MATRSLSKLSRAALAGVPRTATPRRAYASASRLGQASTLSPTNRVAIALGGLAAVVGTVSADRILFHPETS